jgi:hypothetical protein
MRMVAAALAVALGFAAALNYIPGLTDAQGRTFGIFALDIYDDLLHAASATWAAVAAYLSRGAAKRFLQIFGSLYLLDGLMGFTLGSGYLDLGIINAGIQSLPLDIRIFANLPHIALGSIGALSGFLIGRGREQA